MPVEKNTPPPTPGWYPNPSGAANQRYWDGDKWTVVSVPNTGPSKETGKLPRWMALAWIIAGLIVVFLLINAFGGDHGEPSDALPSAESPAATPSAGYVSERTWTDGPWPLTVPEGTLACDSLGDGIGRVTITVGGSTYAVNGTAKGTGEYAELEAIWRDNPEITGTKVNIGPLLDRGLAMC